MNSFRQALIEYAGKKIYFHRHTGNLGDLLIEKGCEHVLKTCSVQLTNDPSVAELILINGGGCFNTYWSGALQSTIDYRTRFPKTPIIVGPQTYSFNDSLLAQLRHLISLGQTPIAFFARETPSYELLNDKLSGHPSWVSIHQSPDLAFELWDSDWLRDRVRRSKDDHVLFAFRNDVESPFDLIRNLAWKHRHAHWNHNGKSTTPHSINELLKRTGC